VSGVVEPASKALMGAALEYFNRGELVTARSMINEMLAGRPEDAHALHLLGLIAYREGDFPGAVGLYERVFPAKRADAVFLNHLGLAMWRTGEHAAAERAFRKAKSLRPDLLDAAQNLVAMLVADGQHDRAESLARELAAARPASGEAWFLLGCVLQGLGNAEEALQSFERALAAGTGNRVEALRRTAALRMQSGRLDDAGAAFQDLQALAGNEAYALAGQGVVAMMRRDHAGAEAAFLAAIDAEPAHTDGILGLASLRIEQDRGAAAEDVLRAGLLRSPEDARLHNALAMRLLGCGAFEEGFTEYAWRHRALSGLAVVQVPDAAQSALGRVLREEPDAIAGRQVSIVGEQGLGDEIFFMRYVPLLAARGAVVQVIASPQVATLLSGHPAIARVLGPAIRLGSRALAAYAGDLPALLVSGTDGVPVPAPLPLAASRAAAGRALEHLSGLPRPLAAVSWRAGAPAAALKLGAVAAKREIDAGELGRALAGAARSAVVVQRNPDSAEIASFALSFGAPVVDLSALNDDLDEMLGVLGEADLCVGVSSTNMHLRASVGLPADVLVSWPPEWRWGDRGDASPWFPSFRLHRQTSSLDWSDALASLRRALAR
jgi:tetratricopeptide (TPR) repeat protein